MPATTPEACDVVLAEYIGAGDLDAIVALYEPAAVLIDAASGAPLEGHAAIRQSFAGLIAAKGRIACRVVKVVRSGELALCYNDWTAAWSDRTASARRSAAGPWRSYAARRMHCATCRRSQRTRLGHRRPAPIERRHAMFGKWKMLALSALLAVPAAAAEQSPEAIVRSVDEAFVRHLEAGDVKGILSLYADEQTSSGRERRTRRTTRRRSSRWCATSWPR